MSRAARSTDNVEPIMSILHKWGVHTVGDFAALDKIDISNRLGPCAVKMWERAHGKSTRLLKLIEPPELFAETFEFEHDVETIDPLLFMLRRFLEQIATRLNAIYLVAEELTLRLSFSNRTEYERVFKIPQPTNDVDLLFRMLHTHLENFKSEHAITAISLDARPTKPTSQQFGLFETALRNPMQLSETLARLVALLGNDRVGTPQNEETHRPDSFRMEPFQWLGGTTSVLSQTLSPALRRFRSEIPISILCDVDLPIHARSSELSGEISERTGPYFLSGNWWDEKNWTRAEWDIELNAGAVARVHQDECGWHLDGIYD
jgi:protein ImuB